MWTLLVYEESDNCFDEDVVLDDYVTYMPCKADCTTVKCATLKELQIALADFKYAEIKDKYGQLNFVYHIFEGKDLLDVTDTNNWDNPILAGKTPDELFDQAEVDAKEKIRVEEETQAVALKVEYEKLLKQRNEKESQSKIDIEKAERAQLKDLLAKYGDTDS